MSIETERMVLDTWQASDWKLFRPIATDPEVMRYITGGTPWTDDQIRSFDGRQISLYTERGFCRWKLLAKPGGALIGFCGVGLWGDDQELEIGWWLARPHWGRGLATEAARAALRDVMERARLDKVVSVAMDNNRSSIRVMQKLGLTLHSAFERNAVQLVRYAITREQYSTLPSSRTQVG